LALVFHTIDVLYRDAGNFQKINDRLVSRLDDFGGAVCRRQSRYR
jgi:hypothetical protein